MAALKMLGKDFVKLVCETLGITSTKVRAVKITADCAGAVMVEVEEYLSAEQAAKIVASLHQPVLISHHVDVFAADTSMLQEGLEKATWQAKNFAKKAKPTKSEAEEYLDWAAGKYNAGVIAKSAEPVTEDEANQAIQNILGRTTTAELLDEHGQDWRVIVQRHKEAVAFMRAGLQGVSPADLPTLPQACSCGGANGAHNYPCPQWKADPYS